MFGLAVAQRDERAVRRPARSLLRMIRIIRTTTSAMISGTV